VLLVLVLALEELAEELLKPTCNIAGVSTKLNAFAASSNFAHIW
jgi:hypothetical protein